MTSRIWVGSAFFITSTIIATSPALGAEPTEDMRMAARLLATLETGNLKGYCAALHGAPYVGYLNRVCQSAVQNKVKKPGDCSQEIVAQQVKLDKEQCLAMPTTEFEKRVLRGREAIQVFAKQMAEQGIDGEELLTIERSKLRCVCMARYLQQSCWPIAETPPH